MAKDHIHILGGGPAGASAALAALSEGIFARIIERPSVIANPYRHKVCGEFFSPEIEPELNELGVWDAFLAARPATIRRMILHFGARSKSANLPEPAWGLSRYRFDGLMLESARAAGARLGTSASLNHEERVDIVATGRGSDPAHLPKSKGNRLFGFKAHFEGPADDAVELFFFDGCYVGINAVELGRTNVCGLGPESALAAFRFDYDELIRQCPALKDRLEPLTRAIPWISTGPLEFQQKFQTVNADPSTYPAGDALSFVDPFTGSGLLAAVRSGRLAGLSAVRGEPVDRYLSQVQAGLQRPFQVASFLRFLVRTSWVEHLAPLIPAKLLFSLTRPQP